MCFFFKNQPQIPNTRTKKVCFNVLYQNNYTNAFGVRPRRMDFLLFYSKHYTYLIICLCNVKKEYHSVYYHQELLTHCHFPFYIAVRQNQQNLERLKKINIIFGTLASLCNNVSFVIPGFPPSLTLNDETLDVLSWFSFRGRFRVLTNISHGDLRRLLSCTVSLLLALLHMYLPTL